MRRNEPRFEFSEIEIERSEEQKQRGVRYSNLARPMTEARAFQGALSRAGARWKHCECSFATTLDSPFSARTERVGAWVTTCGGSMPVNNESFTRACAKSLIRVSESSISSTKNRRNLDDHRSGARANIDQGTGNGYSSVRRFW
jgi:hypothetical protein